MLGLHQKLNNLEAYTYNYMIYYSFSYFIDDSLYKETVTMYVHFQTAFGMLLLIHAVLK